MKRGQVKQKQGDSSANQTMTSFFLLCIVLQTVGFSLFCEAGFVANLSAKRTGVSKWFRNVLQKTPRSRSDEELKRGIGRFYDESSAIWLDVWGEHMHHGYNPSEKYNDHQAAQVDKIDRSVSWAYGNKMPNPQNVLDVGCGVGGSSRHIAKKYGATGKGISLSPYQIMRANDFTKEAGLSQLLEYRVADAMNMPADFEGKFDFTWSMESGEHMPDKKKFFSELVRVTAPGGRIIIVTWCHRDLKSGESLTEKEIRLLDRINDAYFLPAWVPGKTYVDIANSLNLEDIRMADWSEFIAPFWPAVFRSALRPKNFFRLLRTGITTIKGAIATLFMLRGFQIGLVKFVLITAQKKSA